MEEHNWSMKQQFSYLKEMENHHHKYGEQCRHSNALLSQSYNILRKYLISLPDSNGVFLGAGPLIAQIRKSWNAGSHGKNRKIQINFQHSSCLNMRSDNVYMLKELEELGFQKTKYKSWDIIEDEEGTKFEIEPEETINEPPVEGERIQDPREFIKEKFGLEIKISGKS